jgi:hypothetical protein
MTGLILALAGLTCGDGGRGVGAATAPVAVNPSAFDWEGELYAPGVPHPWQVRLRDGVLSFDDPDPVVGLIFQPDGMIVRGGKPWGRYALEHRRLVIHCDGTRICLRPSARKP